MQMKANGDMNTYMKGIKKKMKLYQNARSITNRTVWDFATPCVGTDPAKSILWKGQDGNDEMGRMGGAQSGCPTAQCTKV